MQTDASTRDATRAPSRAPTSAVTSRPATSVVDDGCSTADRGRRRASTASASSPRRRRSTARSSCATARSRPFLQVDHRRHRLRRRRQVHRRARQVDLRLGDAAGERAVGQRQRHLLHGDRAARRRVRQARRVHRARPEDDGSAPRRRTRPRSSSTCSPCCTRTGRRRSRQLLRPPAISRPIRPRPRFSYPDNVVSLRAAHDRGARAGRPDAGAPGAGADAQHHDRRRQGRQPAGAAVRHRHRALPLRLRRARPASPIATA